MDKAKKGAKRALVDVAYVGLYTVITIKGGKPTPLGVGWIA